MRFCPFCGSPAAAWPEYASDYVRGYPLCEFHMRGALKMATVVEYDEQRVKNENKRKEYEAELHGLINAWAEKIEPTFMDDSDPFPIISDVYDRATKNISAWYRPDYGDPISKTIDDVQVDRWFTVRISDLANKRKKYRCCAEMVDQADKRCTNYSTNSDGFCDQCRRSVSRIARACRNSDKIAQIMEILKDD